RDCRCGRPVARLAAGKLTRLQLFGYEFRASCRAANPALGSGAERIGPDKAMIAQQSLINELEDAISSGSIDRRVETLRRVSDLFLTGASMYSDQQIELFDDVIGRLAASIESKARAELANVLASIPNAPVNVIKTLAADEDIDVAGPVLA